MKLKAKQGCLLSPLLFNIIMEIEISPLKTREKIGIFINTALFKYICINVKYIVVHFIINDISESVKDAKIFVLDKKNKLIIRKARKVFNVENSKY